MAGDHPAVQSSTRGKHATVPTVAQLQSGDNSISEDEKLIVLHNPPRAHKLWEGALGSYETKGSLHFASTESKDITIPPVRAISHRENSSFEVRVSIQGRRLNPSVRAEVFIRRGRHLTERVYVARIDWPFRPVNHLGGLPKSGVTELSARFLEGNEYLELTFKPECAISLNLLAVTHDASLLKVVDGTALTGAERSLLKELADMVQYPYGRSMRISFHITTHERALLAAGDINTPHSQLLRALPTSGNKTPHEDFTCPRWRHYRQDGEKADVDGLHSAGDDIDTINDSASMSCGSSDTEASIYGPLEVMFDEMKSRRSILGQRHPGTPIGSLMVFNDQYDALISLSYGVYLEYHEQDATFRAVRRDPHHVRLCKVDSKVLALIDFSTPPTTGFPDDRFRLDDRTKVELRIGEDCMNPDNDKCIKTEGLIVANVFNLPRCDLLVLITDKYAGSFRSLAQPIEAFRSNKKESTWKSIVHVSPVLFKSPYKLEMEAVINSYGHGSPAGRLPFLLGDGSLLRATNPADPAKNNQCVSALAHLRAAKPWNEEQLKVINSVNQAPGGAVLITGPGGTGKTELICHLVQFAVKSGQYTCISGTRNDTLDDMTIKLDRTDPTLQPVRVYSPSQEGLSTLYQPTNRAIAVTGENRLLVDTFEAIEQDTRKSRRSLPRYSVLGRVLVNLERSTPLVRRFRSRGARQPEQDVRAYLKDRLSLLRQNLYDNRRSWINGDEEKDRLAQAYKFLRQEVFQEARIIIATNAVTGNDEVRYNFARDRHVWVFQDEAQSMTEAATLIPLGLHDLSEEENIGRKVVMHVLSGDLKQLPPFTMSRTGRYNTVNEFAQQRAISLLERKINSCFPAVALVEQRRAAEILMRGANMFHYGGKLITPSYPSLAASLQDLLPSLAGFTWKPSDGPEKQRLAWLEVKSRVFENKYTGSRANPANAAVVRECLIKVREAYGKQTNAKVMLATPYKRQKELYLGMACELKDSLGFTDQEIPAIVTIDSLIGRESSLVILDLVNNGTEGFLRDVRRSCVAFTRAKDMFLVVGGRFDLPPEDKLIQPRILMDPVTSKPITADMSRPLAFYYAFFKANRFLYTANMNKVAPFAIPTDLQPLGKDHEDAQAGDEFTEQHSHRLHQHSIQLPIDVSTGAQVRGRNQTDANNVASMIQPLRRTLAKSTGTMPIEQIFVPIRIHVSPKDRKDSPIAEGFVPPHRRLPLDRGATATTLERLQPPSRHIHDQDTVSSTDLKDGDESLVGDGLSKTMGCMSL